MDSDRPSTRTTKYRCLKVALWGGNRILATVLRQVGRPAAFALLETTGRRTGQARQTPVGNGLVDGVFWLVAAHGHQSDLVRNIAADPRVRVKIGGRWRSGTATLLPADDTRARSATLPHQWDAAIGRAIATTPLTVRIDLDHVP